MGEWREVRLGDLVEIFDGPHATPPKTTTGPVFLGISNLVNGRLELSGVEHLSEEDYVRWTRRVTPSVGDVVFSYETRLGEAALILPGLQCCLGRRMGLLRPRQGRIDARFLLYAYLGRRFQSTISERTVHGSTVDRIPLVEMGDFPIYVPEDVREQEAIAAILGAFDDKIELSRRMSETLEAMARALFKSWFVDFDPVRAKAEGRPTHDAASLFPDAFEDSEIGAIPAGWTAAPLGAHFKPVKGVSYKGSGLADHGVPMHNLNSIHEGGGYKYDGLKFYTGEFAGRHVVRPGDVIVANTEQGHHRLLIGYAAIVPRLAGDTGIASHHIYRLDPVDDTPLTCTYVAHLLNSRRMHEVVSGYANGTTVNMLPASGVEKPIVVVPPVAIVQEFDALATSVAARVEVCARESRTLAESRDALLPRLVSGELRVPDAERIAVEAGA